MKFRKNNANRIWRSSVKCIKFNQPDVVDLGPKGPNCMALSGNKNKLLLVFDSKIESFYLSIDWKANLKMQI